MKYFMEELPLVSIVMPIRNEAHYIKRCLNSVLVQDYPAELLEILVVDGMSTDATRDIVGEIIEERRGSSENDPSKINPTIFLLNNPGRIVPTAFNIGLHQAKGEIIIRVDGHCLLSPDHVRNCVKLLEQTGADNVGGLQLAIGENLIGRVISLATSSPFGVGRGAIPLCKEVRLG